MYSFDFTSFDDSLKYLVEQQPRDFIAFGLGTDQIEVLGPLPIALPARSRDVDDVFKVRMDDQDRIAHLEYVRRHQVEDELAIDIAEAQVRLFRRERLPVLSLAWDLYGKVKSPLLEDRALDIGPGCRSTYRRVNLRALGWRQLLEKAPAALWPLAPLTRDGATREAVRQVRDAIVARPELSAAVRADHLAVLRFMAGAEELPEQFLREYIGEEMLTESPFYREIFQKGEAKGKAGGKVEGKAEAKAEGLIRVFVRRFNHVDDALTGRIRTETRLEVLDAWFDDAIILADEQAMLRLAEHIKNTPPPSP